ncbi:MAG: hypothetical protein A2289_23150 [Deltaproteobacteria bacterium RIFOXYA12_FULL_58_15]|nr:MAG: hypothetical protein A2289_23150 [Deltaproteobacteria bacterium RIFOXYA12_FULL_58_15]
MTTTYSHRFHAGNVGDVWKHTVLLAGLDALTKDPSPFTVIDTHAGEGLYRLGSTGEWAEGTAKVLATRMSLPPALERFAHVQRGARSDMGPRRIYMGSPALIAGALRDSDSAHLFELEPDTASTLQRRFASDSRMTVHLGDGLSSLLPLIENLPDRDRTLVFMDPAWETKAEWLEVPAAIGAAHRRRPGSRLVLWYPIKSYTRPNAMHMTLRRLGVPCTIMEVLTSPLEIRRNRLNGSGVLWVNPPGDIVGGLAEAAAVLGTICATHQQWWSTRLSGWQGDEISEGG